MSKYAFTFKKDDVFVEFFTEDKDVVERQFQIWVADADEYARNTPLKAPKSTSEPKAEKTEPTVQPKPTKEKAVAEKMESSIPTIAHETKEETVEEPAEVFDKASTLLKTINNIQNPEPAEEEKTAETANFEDILEKTIDNPTFEPAKTKDPVFLNLVNSKNTTDKFHYLIITSYYLSEFEKLERFTLKQINAKLMNNLSEIVDHTTLQSAINQGFIELIPDLTGTSEVGEYRLTRVGEEFFAKI